MYSSNNDLFWYTSVHQTFASMIFMLCKYSQFLTLEISVLLSMQLNCIQAAFAYVVWFGRLKPQDAVLKDKLSVYLWLYWLHAFRYEKSWKTLFGGFIRIVFSSQGWMICKYKHFCSTYFLVCVEVTRVLSDKMQQKAVPCIYQIQRKLHCPPFSGEKTGAEGTWLSIS